MPKWRQKRALKLWVFWDSWAPTLTSLRNQNSLSSRWVEWRSQNQDSCGAWPHLQLSALLLELASSRFVACLPLDALYGWAAGQGLTAGHSQEGRGLSPCVTPRWAQSAVWCPCRGLDGDRRGSQHRQGGTQALQGVCVGCMHQSWL